MNYHRFLCALMAALLLAGCCLTAQAAVSQRPFILPVEADTDILLDNTCLTMDNLLYQNDTAAIRQDYLDTLLEQYGGVMISADQVSIVDAPDGTSLRTLSNGKVARLLGIENGWYRIEFGKTTGYISVSSADPVVYADYEGTSAVSNIREEVANSAMGWVGVRYSYGGSSRSGTDCSGFTMAVFSAYGYSLIHGASDQYAQSRAVTTQERDVGDLVFFNWGYGIEHVGIYLGGGTFVHASTSSGVIISSLYDSYYANGYAGAGRILPD